MGAFRMSATLDFPEYSRNSSYVKYSEEMRNNKGHPADVQQDAL